ncbi:MAG: ABC transporter permease [Vicinamibacterales bacterium]
MTRARLRWPLFALAAWIVLPPAMLALRALGRAWPFPNLMPSASPGSWTLLENDRLIAALGSSVVLAAMTGVASCALGFALSRAIFAAPGRLRLVATALALFAVVVPPVALSVGLQVALIGLQLNGTLAGVWLAHLIPATGYLTLFGLGVFSAFDFSVLDAARTLGASHRQVWLRIALPLLRRPLLQGILLGGIISWGQLALTSLIGGGLVRTLPVELLAFVRAGDDHLGAVAALVLTLPPLLAAGLLQAGARRSRAAL